MGPAAPGNDGAGPLDPLGDEPFPALDFSRFVGQALDFLGRFHVPPRPLGTGSVEGAFASRPGGAPDLYGAADAAHALFALGALETCSDATGRAAWAERIRAHQNPITGWFDRGRLPGHGVPHATAFATGALVLLDARPAAPLRYAEALFASRTTIERWLDGFRWGQIWTGSHAAGAAAAALDAPEGLALRADWTDDLLDALEARVDPRTGFWKRAAHDRLWRRPTTLDLGGAAHFWWLFDRVGRPVPHAARALDGILGLQRDTGLWGSRLFGGAFPQGIDLDALNGIRLAWRALDASARHRRRLAVRAALERYARAAHRMLTPAGAVDRLFLAPHKLVGTLNALAELDLLVRDVLGARGLGTPAPLRSVLTRVTWQ